MANEIKDAFDAVYVDGSASHPLKSLIRNSVGGVIQRHYDALALKVQDAASIAAAGYQWKAPARVASPTSVAPASLIPGAVVDGATLATGDRVLLIASSSPSANGLYVVNASGAATRATDADAAAELVGLAVFVREGTINGGKQYVCQTPAPIVLGTTNLTFTVLSDQSALNANLTALQAAVEPGIAKTVTSRTAVPFADKDGFTVAEIGDDGSYRAPFAHLRPSDIGGFSLIDDFGFVGFRITNDGRQVSGPSGSSSSSDYSDEEIASRNARALAYSAQINGDRTNTARRLLPGFNHIIEYGQSLSVGAGGWPRLTKASLYSSVKMLGGSVRGQGGGGTTTFAPFAPTGLQNLVATVTSTTDVLTDATVAGMAPDANTPGETFSVAAVNTFKRLWNQLRGVVDDTDRTIIVTSCGIGGKTIAELSKGASPEFFARLPSAATQAKAAAGSNPYGVTAIIYAQGEEDYVASTDGEVFKTRTRQLYADIKADVVTGVAGQSEPPVVFAVQPGASFTRDDKFLQIGNAHIDLAEDDRNWILVGPYYPVTDKGGHLDPNGYRWLGCKIGQVMHRVLNQGLGWKPLQPIGVTARGRTVLIQYHVPKPPLQFRAPYVQFVASVQDQQGFRATDDTGDITLSATIAGDAVVKLTLSREPNGPLRIWYADKTTHNGNGSLCDSDGSEAFYPYQYANDDGSYPEANIPALVGSPYPLNNWSVAFSRIAVVD
ncbi:hypothetical protein C8J36_103517 [Rhizobium sp. PP-F2F-G48]|uniref:sialate O-acetylesterase n=1 Tax=Rhizobium sp. PP-F2F-G48 TaxID=2135651 RepID=UPI00104B3EF6|nr:sialate O-acetylesterase [Rhizobium sp. PP-F2F-G48]TCM56147.1 hypothetical protein C8J36_103517 [Rhizobium sp. PP-F2F-G48]